jgi:hypothetical protein
MWARRSAAFSAGVLVLCARLLLATAHHRRCRSWLETNDDVAMHPRRQRDSRLILGKLACGEILEFVTWGRHNVPGGLRTIRTLQPVCSDRSRHAAADRWIWQSRPLRIKWQDWIAPGGRIIVHRECCQWQHKRCTQWQHSIATSIGQGSVVANIDFPICT